jgi:hypothetical protein
MEGVYAQLCDIGNAASSGSFILLVDMFSRSPLRYRVCTVSVKNPAFCGFHAVCGYIASYESDVMGLW